MNLSPISLRVHLTSREFLSIVGRLQFAEAQVMGRMGKLALSRIRTWMSQQRVLVTRELLEEFRLLAERFRREKPREVPMLVDSKSILVFTDGASEADCHTVGGVLVFPDETCPRFFGADVPGPLVDKWFSATKHIIGPVETYMPWWLPDLFGINIWWGRGVFISVTTMVQWMHSSKALRATLTFGSYFCASKNSSAMVITGLGFPESLLRAIVLMTLLELDTCLAVTCKVQFATDVCVHLLAWSFQILWAQLDLDKWGWMMCFAPTSCEKKRDVL